MRDQICDVINYRASSFSMWKIKCIWSDRNKKIWEAKEMDIKQICEQISIENMIYEWNS